MTTLPGAVNPCDFLYKLASQRSMPPPTFEQISEAGPPHQRIYIWQGEFFGMTAQGQGRSKKEARIAAAKAIKSSIKEEELPAVSKTFQDALSQKRKKEGGTPESKAKKKYDYQKHIQMQQLMAMGNPQEYFGDEWGAPGTMGPMGPGPLMGQTMLKMGPPDPEYMMPGPMGFAGPFGPPGMRFPGPFPPMMMGFMGPPQHMPPQKLKRGDYHVIEKHKTVYPAEATLAAILGIAERTQKALEKSTEVLNKADDFNNKLLGGAKVGGLAKGTLLSNDTLVNLVVMCRDFPTRTQLRRLTEEVEKELKEREKEKEGSMDEAFVTLMEGQGGFCVTITTKPVKKEVKEEEKEEGAEAKAKKEEEDEGPKTYTVVVTMSSIKVRQIEEANKKKEEGAKEGEVKKEGEEEEEDDKNGDEMETEDNLLAVADRLPKDSCLWALSEIRHAKWFDARAACLTSCVECIRVMKEMARREREWAVLNDWAIELLVQKAVETANWELTPSRSLMRVMEVVASGIFIPGFGPCLADPCERGKVSATPGMTRQQAEELTVSAQKYLRMMHFNKIHLVLDMEPLPRKVGWDKRKNKKSEGDKKESEEAAKDEEMKTS